MNTIEGNPSASKYKFAIILSRFNEFIGERLLEGAVDCLKEKGYFKDSYDLIKVPGAFEIPVAAEKLASQQKYDAIICLGAVIRGGTPHFEYVAGGVSRGIMDVSIKHSLPIIFGVLTTDTIEQAMERSGVKSGNKGYDSALAAIEMADLSAKLK